MCQAHAKEKVLSGDIIVECERAAKMKYVPGTSTFSQKTEREYVSPRISCIHISTSFCSKLHYSLFLHQRFAVLIKKKILCK